MKKVLLFAMLLLPQLLVAQDDGVKFLEEGKEWRIKHTNYHHFGDSYTFRYFIDGDTLVNGRTCMKLFSENENKDGATMLVGCLYEENLQVYYMKATVGQWYVVLSAPSLLYDFSLQVGDSVDYVKPHAVVMSADSTFVRGRSLYQIGLRHTNDAKSHPECFWVSGVGCSCGLLSPTRWGRDEGLQLESCTIGTDTLFTYEDFGFANHSEETPRNPYHSMINEGKNWIYQLHHFEEKGNIGNYEETVSYVTFVIEGDTMITDKIYNKMYQISGGIKEYHSCWLEEEKRIYVIMSKSDEPHMLYAFNIKDGNEYWLGTGSFSYLDHTESFITAEIKLNCYIFNDLNDHEFFRWIEGIGGNNGILYPQPIIASQYSDYLKLIRCVEDGIQLYPIESDIEEVSLLYDKPKDKGNIYDLSGRRVANSSEFQGSSFRLPKGVYIQNGKKFVVK